MKNFTNSRAVSTVNKKISRQKSILVVDDDENFCRTLKLVLDKKGYKSDIAFSGVEALVKMRKKSFDLCMLALKLSKAKGWDLISKFKVSCPDLRIIMIDGDSAEENAVKYLHNEVLYCAKKPFNLDKVLKKINTILEERERAKDKKPLKKSKKQKPK